MNSKPGEMNKEDWKKAGKAAVIWFAPVVLIYLGAVLGNLQQEGHVFMLKDFIPSTFTQGAIATWFVSQLQGLFLRWSS